MPQAAGLVLVLIFVIFPFVYTANDYPFIMP